MTNDIEPKKGVKIPLTNSKLFAIVDADDYDFLMQWKWYLIAQGCAVRKIHINLGVNKYTGKVIRMHRVINKTPDEMKTDHIDGDRLNNQKKNLRNATSSQNTMNRRAFYGASKYKGVNKRHSDGKWEVKIRANHVTKYLGSFVSEKEAALAYNQAALKYHGEYACLNTI